MDHPSHLILPTSLYPFSLNTVPLCQGDFVKQEMGGGGICRVPVGWDSCIVLWGSVVDRKSKTWESAGVWWQLFSYTAASSAWIGTCFADQKFRKKNSPGVWNWSQWFCYFHWLLLFFWNKAELFRQLHIHVQHKVCSVNCPVNCSLYWERERCCLTCCDFPFVSVSASHETDKQCHKFIAIVYYIMKTHGITVYSWFL